MPLISILNESTAIADTDIRAMMPAFDHQWNKDLSTFWGIDVATFTFIPQKERPATGSWWLVFVDDSDQAGALAYHDLTNERLPLAKVFVKNILGNNASVSVAATHQLCEMAVDPWLISTYEDAEGVSWAGDICDPVAGDKSGYKVDGILVTDFVTPRWFGRHGIASGSRLDFKNHVSKPFSILSRGYALYFDPQKGWVPLTGSKASRFATDFRRDLRTKISLLQPGAESIMAPGAGASGIASHARHWVTSLNLVKEQ